MSFEGKTTQVSTAVRELTPQREPSVGKQTLTEASFGNGASNGYAAANMNLGMSSDPVTCGVNLEKAFIAIRSAPNLTTVGTELRRLTLHRYFSGLKCEAELGMLLQNFAKVCNGVDGSFDWFKMNMGWFGDDVIGGYHGRLVQLATTAWNKTSEMRLVRKNAEIAKRPHLTKAQAVSNVDRVMLNVRGANMQKALDGLEQVSLPVENARMMMKLYWGLFVVPTTGGDFHDRLDRLERFMAKSLKDQTVTKHAAEQVKRKVDDFRQRYPRQTPAQIAERRKESEDRKDKSVERGQWLLDGLDILKESLDKRNGWTVNGGFHAHNAKLLITKRRNELIAAITKRDEAAIERVYATDPVPWMLNQMGGPDAFVEHLEKLHTDGVAFLDKTSDVIGVLPGIGNLYKLAVSSLVESIKYASNAQSGAETVVNIAIKSAGIPMDKWLGTPAVRHAFLSAARGFVETLIKDGTKVANEKDMTASKFWERLPGLLQKALGDAFIAVITGRLKILTANMDESKRKAVIDSILDAAGKLGIEAAVKPALEKFTAAPPEPKRRLGPPPKALPPKPTNPAT